MAGSDSTEKKHGNLKPFQPGQSGNPAGRPKGSRNKLGEAFLEKLCADFEANGQAAIETVRTEDPSTYIKVCASILPKEFIIERPLDGLTDAELAAAIADIRERLAGPNGAGSRVGKTEKPKPAGRLPAVH